MGWTILLHPKRMGPVFNEVIFICWDLITKMSSEIRTVQWINQELATAENFHQTEVKHTYKVLADITFRMEKFPVAGSVVRVIFMHSKLSKIKSGVSYFVRLKHMLGQRHLGTYTSYSDIGLSQA
jgi:hypothetical protein